MYFTTNPVLGFIPWVREYLGFTFIDPWSFFSNPLTQEGFCLPALFSLWIFLKYTTKTSWTNWKMLLTVEAVCVLAGWVSLRWGSTGLHIFDLGFIMFPIIAYLRPSIPMALFYALDFLIGLSGDVWGDIWTFHFQQGWYFGIGGAGFHDSLFLAPLETLAACIVLRYGLAFLSRYMRRPFLDEYRNAKR
ncbi:hypothetical protein JKG47_15985 [Acidithiobacillus sp. MC6.1]|nr:hypothetical protein [Acidithiobacillus sp. MC6.1]